MVCFCEFLYNILPNTASKVQAWAATGVFCLTGFMTYYARKALTSWKDQEKHQAEIELMRYLAKSHDIVTDLRIGSRDDIDEAGQNELKKYQGEFRPLKEKSIRLNVKLKQEEFEISEIRAKYTLAVSLLDLKNPLRDYYHFIADLLDSVKLKSKLFTFYVNSLDTAKKDFVEERENLEKLKEIGEKGFDDSSFKFLYINYNDALEDVTESYKLNKENWDMIFKNAKQIEMELFRPLIIHKKSARIDQKIKIHYDNANKYCDSYSNPKKSL